MNCICSGILFADIACWPLNHIPEEGELVTTEKIELNLGGCAANVALDLSRLNVPSRLAGCIGDDALSDFISRAVQAPGIQVELQRSANRCPGTAMHLNVRDQDRRFICTTGANEDFVIDANTRRLLETPAPEGVCRVFYIGGFFMLRALENEQTLDILREARKNGWTVLLDVVLNGHRPYWDVLEPFLPYADIFMPNEHEGEKITDYRDTYDQAKMFRDAGAGRVVITQGEGGTLCFGENENFRTGIYPTDYVSGSGAGDAFCAGMIAALLDGRDMRDAVRWGSALGASSVRSIGTTESVFNRTELERFLEENTLAFEEV